jgi:hypothetical protein
MKKIVISFAIILMFLGLAFIPAINSSFVKINSENEGEQNEDKEYIEVEVYDFKGFYGFEKTVKKLTTKQYNKLKNDLDSIKMRDSSLKTDINQQIQVYKKYNLISNDYSYEQMEKTYNKQKPILRLWAYQSFLNCKFNKSIKKDNCSMNLLALSSFEITEVVGISIGISPTRFLWPYVFPWYPIPSLWATALFSGYGFANSTGLLGKKSFNGEESYSIFFMLGFIGITILISYNQSRVPPFGDFDCFGIGFSAFMFSTEIWGGS